MTYAEMNKNFCTGEQVALKITDAPGQVVPATLYRGGLGDCIQAYVRHCKAPFWRRDGQWRHVEDMLRRALNQSGPTVEWFI